jgi:glycosyltransferase involved in cell wall biosynthesis
MPDPKIFLWAVEVDYANRRHHGGMMRYVALGRELLRMGHQVHFLVSLKEEERDEARAWLRSLVSDGIATDFLEISYSPNDRKIGWASRLQHPRLSRLVLKSDQSAAVRQVRDLVNQRQVDVFITSGRRLWFLAPECPRHVVRFVDMGDSEVLCYWREGKNLFRARRYGDALRTFYRMIHAAIVERYYSRVVDRTIFVSPVDKQVLDRLAGNAQRNLLLLNGVTIPELLTGEVPKLRNRLIFTGNMDFGPNFEAALFFLDSVFPIVLREFPDAVFVLAGANPIPELIGRASDNVQVLGFVNDMNFEIACSAVYVAPLITGGGFKNKVVEAMANRTFVVAMPMAAEFLPAQFRDLVTVAESAPQMANAIIEFLRDPDSRKQTVDKLYHLIAADHMSWNYRACELINSAAEAHG